MSSRSTASKKTRAGSKRARVESAGVPVRVLKDRISEYLKAVEAGEVVVITSHGRAVAELIPHREHSPALTIRPASRAWGSVRLPRPGTGKTDSVALLLEDRRKR